MDTYKSQHSIPTNGTHFSTLLAFDWGAIFKTYVLFYSYLAFTSPHLTCSLCVERFIGDP